MKRFLFAILLFCISFVISYQFVRIPASQIPFHGEAFVDDSILNGIIYFLLYTGACVIFAKKFSYHPKVKHIIYLILFFSITSIIGFLINGYIYLNVLTGSPVHSNPSINGDSTTIKQQDYRHGRRCIFRNGKKIAETKEKRHIDENMLSKMQ